MKNINYRLSLLSIAVWLIVTSSCQSDNQAHLSEQEKQQITAEIERVVLNFIDPSTINSDTHTSLRANEDGYMFAGDGMIIFTDYESYANGIRSSFENIDHFTKLKSTKMSTYALSHDAGTCTTEFEGEYVNAAGDTIVHNGCWTFVFKKFDGEWKVIQENGTHTGK